MKAVVKSLEEIKKTLVDGSHLRGCFFIPEMEELCGKEIEITKNNDRGYPSDYSRGGGFCWQKEWLIFPPELNRKPLNLEILTETGFKTVLEDGQVNVCFEAFDASKDDLEHFTDVLEASLGKDALVTYFKNRFDLYTREDFKKD